MVLRIFASGFFILGLTVFGVSVDQVQVHAQGEQSDTKLWFKQGQAEVNVRKKIYAFERALQIDPEFAEAHYFLALTYKSIGEFDQAIAHLRKASIIAPERVDKKLRQKILFELARTLNESQHFDEALSILEALAPLVDNAGLAATVREEQAEALAGLGRYEESVALLQELGRSNPRTASELHARIQEVERRAQEAEKQRELAKAKYDQATAAQAMGDLQRAKALYEEIQALIPGFLDVEARVVQVDSLLKGSTESSILQGMYEQAQRYERDGDLNAAFLLYQTIVDSAGDFKDVNNRLNQLQQQLAKQEQERVWERDYEVGMTALRQKKWVHAIYAFEKIAAQNPGFRDVRERLRQAQRGLDREGSDAVLSLYYAQGVLALKQGDYHQAVSALSKVDQINPNYRNVSELLQEAQNQLESRRAAEAAARRASQIDSLRMHVSQAARVGEWERVVATLEVLQTLQPEDTTLAEQLRIARARLTGEAVPSAAGATDSVWQTLALVGTAFASLLVPVIGIFLFSPITRARWHLLRGRFADAAAIYEKLLARNPGNVKLYATLAHVYLLAGRHDANAVKVYKTVLQLGLEMPHRERLQSLVTEHYVAAESQVPVTDEAAIALLEQELQRELAKRKRLDTAKTAEKPVQ